MLAHSARSAFPQPAHVVGPGRGAPNVCTFLASLCTFLASPRKGGHPLFHPPVLSRVLAIHLRRPKLAYSGTPAPTAVPWTDVGAWQGPQSAPGQVLLGKTARRGRSPRQVPPQAAVALRKAACGPHCPHRPFSPSRPQAVPQGVTSNKGGRSLVLTNFGPLRPPVRRTSAPLRCSSSPTGNGRFRWERSRSEISELSPLGGSKRYAACGDAFGWWGVVLKRGNTKSPS